MGEDLLHRFASRYALQFGWCVFPCRGKSPAVARRDGGRGCLDATSDLDRISAYWLRYPGSNIGIATGPRSGFWVLDVDGDEGRANLDALQAEHGRLPDTLGQITGSGGCHLLFSIDPFRPIRNRAKRLTLPSGERLKIPGIDVRGEGGYIIAPPSIHPDTHLRYVWETRPGQTPIADAPDWLLDMVSTASQRRVDTPVARIRPPTDSDWGPKPRYSRAALERACITIASTPPGRQDVTLNSESYAIGRLVAGGYMPQSFALATLVHAGLQMVQGTAQRPWSRTEIENKVKRAFDDARTSPRTPGPAVR